jgi:hypothetical protein
MFTKKPVTPQGRGLALLKLVLSPQEYHRWSTGGGLWVTGSEGGRYKIDPDGYQGNVYYYEGNQKVCSFCAHIRMTWTPLPLSDNAVAQILAIKRDEFAFLNLANTYQCWDYEAARRRKQQAYNAMEARRPPAQQSNRWFNWR